ncbi:MAG: dUTP diphosphatase [Acutalibacteraceae bacterium]|nr:dUTP diphosphatase [Acutalibacteraceae bacterium]
MEIKIKKLRENAIIPSRGSLFAAGYDLYACLDGENITIEPHKSAKIGTGIAAALPAGYFGAIFARSGLATKQSLRPANCVGVVDSDYRGEFIVCLHNDSDEVRIINNGERIAQLVLMPFMEMDFIETDALDETERGVGGFGSTGK